MTDAKMMWLAALTIYAPARLHEGNGGITWVRDYYPPGTEPRTAPWRPLMNGHQALMLMHLLNLELSPMPGGGWSAVSKSRDIAGIGDEPRRAIVLCAANIATADMAQVREQQQRQQQDGPRA